MGVTTVELAASQFDQHLPHQGRDFVKHLLELNHLCLLAIDVLLNFDPPLFILRRFVEDALFFLVIPLELLVFGSQIVIDIHKIVDLLVEYIYVCEQVIILLFPLNKGILNLQDISEASCFLDSCKGLVDYLHIPLVIIYQLHLLLVVHYQFCQPVLQHCCCVILDSVYLSSAHPTALVVFWVFQPPVELSQFLIVAGLFLLVCHLESQHHILVHLASVLTLLNVHHQRVNLLVGLIYIALQASQVVLVHSLLLPQLIDSLFELSNFSHSLVVTLVINVNLLLKVTHLSEHHLHFSFLTLLFQLGYIFFQRLDLSLQFDLHTLQCQQVATLPFVLFSVVVGLSLQFLCLVEALACGVD